MKDNIVTQEAAAYKAIYEPMLDALTTINHRHGKLAILVRELYKTTSDLSIERHNSVTLAVHEARSVTYNLAYKFAYRVMFAAGACYKHELASEFEDVNFFFVFLGEVSDRLAREFAIEFCTLHNH